MNMLCTIGLGSNLGDRLGNLEAAIRALLAHPAVSALKTGPIFTTPAMLPPDAPAEWNIPYLNSALTLAWSETPERLLETLKQIETALGRIATDRWGPRPIDLDILLFGNEQVATPDLQIPHYGLLDRSFVLDPLLHLCPGLVLPNGEPLLQRARALPGHAPLWMGILNLTPDSFSDGGQLAKPEQLVQRLGAYDEAGIQILDLGAESTRPGALPLTETEEWLRLAPALEIIDKHYRNRLLRPKISIDTYRAATASKALAKGATVINDVSGLADSAMLPLLKSSDCDYVLMHSLSIPADKNVVLDKYCDPVAAVRGWAEAKLAFLQDNGIALSRIIFDPGIGFGKTPQQSLALLRRCHEFLDLPVRLLIGHSRKSFMSIWSQRPAAARDDDGIGISLRLAEKRIDILRVHAADRHSNAWLAAQLAA